MSISSKLDRLHLRARENKWLWFFAIFNRFCFGDRVYIPSGMVKILGSDLQIFLSPTRWGIFYMPFTVPVITTLLLGCADCCRYFTAHSAHINPWRDDLFPDYSKHLHPVVFGAF